MALPATYAVASSEAGPTGPLSPECAPSLRPELRYVNGTKGSGPAAERRVMTQRARRKRRYSFPVDETSLSHLGIKRAVEFMQEHHSATLDLEQAATEACLSKYHFSRLFHRMVGMSYAWIIRLPLRLPLFVRITMFIRLGITFLINCPVTGSKHRCYRTWRVPTQLTAS